MESLTLTVKVELPAAGGLPNNAPVVGDNVMPAGGAAKHGPRIRRRPAAHRQGLAVRSPYRRRQRACHRERSYHWLRRWRRCHIDPRRPKPPLSVGPPTMAVSPVADSETEPP